MGLPADKIIVRIPATWEGIQAAKKLEAEGIATHIILVYRCENMHFSTDAPNLTQACRKAIAPLQ